MHQSTSLICRQFRRQQLCSPNLSPCRYAPRTNNLSLSQRGDRIVHVHARANMIGNDSQYLADLKLPDGFRNVQETMLFIKFDDGDVGGLDDISITALRS
jgi:hypothetical protein